MRKAPQGELLPISSVNHHSFGVIWRDPNEVVPLLEHVALLGGQDFTVYIR